MFFVHGFSQYMSLPALAAFIAAVACQFGPVAISTASISSRVEQLAKVAIPFAILIAVLFVGHLLDRIAALCLHIADGHELHVLLLQEAAQVVRAAVADADAAQRIRSLGATAPSSPKAELGIGKLPNADGGQSGTDRSSQKTTPRYTIRPPAVHAIHLQPKEKGRE